MIEFGTALRYYKKPEIQKGIVESTKNREVAVRFNQGFGKRPDVLSYESDVLEQVKNKATSFHVSEEIWNNPLQIASNSNKRQLDEIRSGWDLVLDIDCPDWEFSKLTTYLFIKALKESGIKSLSCKFSGNKGFHIGVPFEAFPEEFNNQATKDLFPEGPRKIAQYLLYIISNKYVTVEGNNILFDKEHSLSLSSLKDKFGDKEFIITKCAKCDSKIEKKGDELNEFICPKCESSIKNEKDFMKCEKCNVFMERLEKKSTGCSCGSNETISIFDPLSIIEVDTILIASRHLYRSVYSLNEKSGLASVPINPEKVLEFNKIIAQPDNVRISKFKFLDTEHTKNEEGLELLKNAFSHEEIKESIKIEKEQNKNKFAYEEIKEAVPEEFFPPCIKHVLAGIGDGKKRALFILVNFLTQVGWTYEKIEERLREWNKKNKEPLKEVYMIGQVRYHKTQKKKVLPPNCDNKMYYEDLQICKPDELCKKIRNPVNYTRRKTFYLNKNKRKTTKE